MIRPHRWVFIAAIMWIVGHPHTGTARADDVQVNTFTSDSQLHSSVAMDADGDFVVVWDNTYGPGGGLYYTYIQGQRYASDGSTAGGEFQVNTYTTSLQFYPSVAMDADGDFVVVWSSFGSDGTDSSGHSIQGQRYASDGSTAGGEFQINTFIPRNQLFPSVAMDADGDFVVVWESNGSAGTDPMGYSIQGQRYASDGSPLGAEFQVNTYTSNNQTRSSVALTAAGDFVVVWQSDGSGGTDSSDRSIQGQRYASDGSTVGGEFQVNTYTTDRQAFASVALSAAGDFVVVWYSEGSAGTDSSGLSIQGQRYASDGSTAGGEFQVNTYTTSHQGRPSVAIDADGDFAVVWHSLGSGGTDVSDRSIQGRRYASDGSPIGDDFQVNTYTPQSQLRASVAIDGAGDFVVAWESDGSAGSDTDDYSIQRSAVESVLGGLIFADGFESGDTGGWSSRQ